MEEKIILGFDNSDNTESESDALFPKEIAVFDPTKEYIHLYTSSEDFKNKRAVNYHEPFVGAFVNDTDNIGAQYNKINMAISQSEYMLLHDDEELKPDSVGTVFAYNTAKYYNIKRLKAIIPNKHYSPFQ